jgi:hypothetical protein
MDKAIFEGGMTMEHLDPNPELEQQTEETQTEQLPYVKPVLEQQEDWLSVTGILLSL